MYWENEQSQAKEEGDPAKEGYDEPPVGFPNVVDQDIQQANNDSHKSYKDLEFLVFQVFIDLFDPYRVKAENEEKNEKIPAPEFRQE
ncbi:hypothetical protein GCM10010465_24230 [Actinomadura fibrosa]